MTIQPMSPADAAWFHNDGPANPAIMTGVLITKQPLDFAAVRAVYEDRLLEFPRFRQRVVERGFPATTPHWQDMPQFDIDQHVHHIALPAPHDEVALRRLVSDIASTALDHALPLWQVHVVDGVEGGSALVMRCHHCIADGTAMMAVSRKLFDAKPGVGKAIPATTTPASAEETGLMALTEAVIHTAANPKEVIDKAATLLSGAGMLIGELFKADDPQSPLKGSFAAGKSVAWSKPVSIKDIKMIGAQHGAKVNDVLVAVMTGALRRYLQGRGVDVNHLTLRAMVPVDLRAPEYAGQLGNAFGLVLLELAVSTARPDQRLALTKVRMDALKRSPEPVAARVLLELLGRVPKVVEDFSNNLFGRKASLVMSNVVGPSEVLYLAGAAIDRMLAWAPHPGTELGMAITMLSYHGLVSLTISSDAHLLADPEVIADYFHREFQAVLEAVPPGRIDAPVRKRAAKQVSRARKHKLSPTSGAPHVL